MLHALLALLAFQLVGETIARASGAPLPGPVIGMVLLLGMLVALPGFAALMRPVATGILAHLSLLFVPAGVGVVGHFAALGGQTLALLVALILSTVLAIAAGALTFAAVARMTGSRDIAP
jgi:holin-like protein